MARRGEPRLGHRRVFDPAEHRGGLDGAEHRKNILGAWTYGAVWTQGDAPRPGLQRNGVTVVQHFGRD